METLPVALRRTRARSRVPRCAACRMHHDLCVCSFMQATATRTRLVLLLHQLEEAKPTNTGRIAARCLSNSVVITRGGSSVATAPDWLAGATNPVLLYPENGARPISDWKGTVGPVTLIVPDGTWRQARKARRRVPGLGAIPCATIPPGAPSAYRLRSAPHPDHLCTLEAIARALGVIEGPKIQRHLEQVLAIVVERTLWSRGKLRAQDVEGGLPPEALLASRRPLIPPGQ